MFGLGPMEIILIVLVIALIFGAKKLPELGKGMGRGIKEFKQELNPDAAPTKVTDVSSRQLDPVTGAPLSAERPAEVPADRRS